MHLRDSKGESSGIHGGWAARGQDRRGRRGRRRQEGDKIEPRKGQEHEEAVEDIGKERAATEGQHKGHGIDKGPFGGWEGALIKGSRLRRHGPWGTRAGNKGEGDSGVWKGTGDKGTQQQGTRRAGTTQVT
ncbi:hypothetical protein E2C01_076621 [Portunus trituberculatus]|uniref:Uncharacterized protein n=1 Tax=Portunus trituberculatus TaxID=210409 RepID=A0A5B7IJ73_PORTR|nr:hypothetical protein [Portunus trituberculatus]